MSPRWRKVRNDLIRQPSRSVLATLSLIIGVFAVGSIQLATDDIQRSFRQAFEDSNLPSVLMTTDPFERGLIEEVRGLGVMTIHVGDAG